MKGINVEVRSIKVSSFSPNKEEISFVVAFNDGKDKEITKNAKLDKGESVAVQIIKDIRKVEGSLHAEFDGRAVLDSYMSIAIKNEGAVIEKMGKFIGSVFEKVSMIHSMKVADGYMALINKVNSMRLDF